MTCATEAPLLTVGAASQLQEYKVSDLSLNIFSDQNKQHAYSLRTNSVILIAYCKRCICDKLSDAAGQLVNEVT
jgi:hypothetical protein